MAGNEKWLMSDKMRTVDKQSLHAFLWPQVITSSSFKAVARAQSPFLLSGICFRLSHWENCASGYFCFRRRLILLTLRIHILSTYNQRCITLATDKVKNVRLSLYTPGEALRVPGGWGSQISRQSIYEGGQVVSLTHRPLLPPRKYS
jgi:hypothetical protein